MEGRTICPWCSGTHIMGEKCPMKTSGYDASDDKTNHATIIMLDGRR